MYRSFALGAAMPLPTASESHCPSAVHRSLVCQKPRGATVSNETQSVGDPCTRLPAGANGCKGGKTVEAYVPKQQTATTVKQSASTQRETYCRQYPRGSFPKPDGGWEFCDVRDDTANQVLAAAPLPILSAPAVAPAASPAIATGTADIPKPCFTDKSGHTVCLAPHQ